nr:MAG TPA: hypothetical protein [Caudoviricetes sp.]
MLVNIKIFLLEKIHLKTQKMLENEQKRCFQTIEINLVMNEQICFQG